MPLFDVTFSNGKTELFQAHDREQLRQALQGIEFREVVPGETEEYTCTELKRLGIIDEQESGGVACCPRCVSNEHDDKEEEDNYPHPVWTPKGRRIDFCCMCYDYVPVSSSIRQSQAWIDEALDKIVQPDQGDQ